MRAITRDTWRLGWFVDQLYRFSDAPVCTGVHTTSVRQLVCSVLWWYLLNVPEHVCVHVTDSRTRAKSKFSHSVTSFRSKLLHTSQRLSTSRIFFFFTFILVKLRNIASAIIKRSYPRRNSLLTWRNSSKMHTTRDLFSHTRFSTSALIAFTLLIVGIVCVINVNKVSRKSAAFSSSYRFIISHRASSNFIPSRAISLEDATPSLLG